MKILKGVEVFKTGTHRSADGQETSYTINDLEEMAEGYDPGVHEAPVVWGHENDRAWDRKVNRNTQLSNGWVKEPYVKGKSLVVDLKVDDDTFNAIKDEKLKKRSIGLYEPDSPNNPTPGKYYIRHLALLGTEPPAIKGLKDIVIYSEDFVYNIEDDNIEDKTTMDKEEAKQMLDSNIKDWLAAALKDDGNGFGETIIDFKPEPDESNNWLWNEEEQEYKGQILTDREQVFDFVIKKNEDGSWSTMTKMVSDDGEEVEGEGEEMMMEEMMMEDKAEIIDTPEEMEAEMMEDDDKKAYSDADGKCWEGYERVPGTKAGEKGSCRKIEMMEEDKAEIIDTPEEKAAEMGEGCDGERKMEEQAEVIEMMKAELAEMREKMAKYNEEKKAAKREAIIQFSEGLYEGGILTDGSYSQKDLNNLLMAVFEANETTPILYSEGEKQVDLVEGIQNLLKSLPKVVEFNEATARAINDEVVKESIPAAFGEVTKEGAKEYMKIAKYQKDNNIATFLEAKRRMEGAIV